MPFAEAAPLFQLLREELLPDALRARTPAERERMWPQWVESRDAAIRQRVIEGDEESVINLLLFGTTFTRRPRPTDSELSALVVAPAEGVAALRPRLDDFVTALVSPGADERLQFARRVIARAGIDPPTTATADQTRRYLEGRMQAVAANSAAVSRAVDAGGALAISTMYRTRGLSSDTSLLVDYGIDRALEAMAGAGTGKASVQRVAIVGPGLDFTDKLWGYDFYPQQTIQPFAVIDSLIRHGLSDPGDVQVTAFDVSPRIIQHLDTARARAKAGSSYGLVLLRDVDRSWTPDLVAYWRRLGDRIGEETPTTVTPPATAGRVQVRGIRVRPSIVLATTARDLNIVLKREERGASEQFDLVIATNILLYYGVFEQALAMANIAHMLAPGGVFLTNTRLVELPDSPMRSVGYTDSVYTTGPGGDETGDRIWRYAH
jgi:hypothetical protein